MTATFTLATTPREQALADVFCTALEGGIGYWSVCSAYKWSDGTRQMNQINEFHAVIHDTEDGENTHYVIDSTVIRNGIRRAYEYLKTEPGYQADAIRGLYWNREDVDFDADTADMIVQFGLNLINSRGGTMYG